MNTEERKRLREWAETQRTARADFGLAEQPMYAAVPALLDALERAEHQLTGLGPEWPPIDTLKAENAALREQLDEAEAKIKRLTAHLKPGYRTGAVSREFHLQLVEAKDAENSALRERVAVLEKAGKECVEWAEGFCHEGRDDKTGEYKHEYGVSGGSHDRGEWEAFEDAVATLRAALDGVKQ